jgi:hypothetical protein
VVHSVTAAVTESDLDLRWIVAIRGACSVLVWSSVLESLNNPGLNEVIAVCQGKSLFIVDIYHNFFFDN